MGKFFPGAVIFSKVFFDFTCSGIFEYDEKAFSAFHQFGGYVVKFRPQWLSKIPLADRMFMARFLHRSIPKAERQAFLEHLLTRI